MAEEREPHRVLHRWFDIKPGGDFQEVATSEPLSTIARAVRVRVEVGADHHEAVGGSRYGFER